MEKINEKKFETFDWALAAFLMVHGILWGARPFVSGHDNRVEVKFFTTESEEVARLVEKFYENCPIPIQDFLKASKEIKDLMMSLVRQQKYLRQVPERQLAKGNQGRKG